LAEVQYSDKELYAQELGTIRAENLDARLLNKINEQRKKEAEARDKEAQLKMEARYAALAVRKGLKLDDEVMNKRVKSSFIPIRKLQESESHVTAFKKQFKKDLRLIGQIKFHYNKYRTYAIWLEVAHGGRFGIISRALQYWSAKANTEIKRIANLKQFSITIGHDITHASTQAEVFEEYIARETAQTGVKYKPFSRAVQAERNRRRRERNSEPTIRGHYKPRKKK
jgi:hypothetical protein